MIKLEKKRATITDGFLQKAVETAKRKADEIRADLDRHPTWRQNLLKEKRETIANIKVLTDLDRLATSLRCLPYSGFDVVDDFFVGRTLPITMVSNAMKNYDAGEYLVFVRTEDFLGGMVKVGLIPVKDPKTYARTPHHYATDTPRSINPWLWPVSTCLGGFGSLLANTYQYFNLPEMFRAWHMYLSRYNEASPLVRIHYCEHIKETK